MVDGLKQRRAECDKRYSTQPFSNFCNISREYPCFLNYVTNPLDIVGNRPCIQLTQIGDHVPDCYEAQDEKNTLADENGGMIRFSIRCGQYHIKYSVVCETDACNDSKLCWYKRNTGACSGLQDMVCLNGRCAKNARCNGIYECPEGEDEYWCYTRSISGIGYQDGKIWLRTFQSKLITWPIFPDTSETYSYIENTTNKQ